MRAGAGSRQPRRGECGSLLLEVVVATLLVGLLAGPLVGAVARAVHQSRATREQPQGSADPELSGAGGGWGARVIAAWWRPGPALYVRVSVPSSGVDGCGVGVWTAGWPLAQETYDGDLAGSAVAGGAGLRLGPEVWAGHEGEELVLRVREPEGHWGPPWRAAVPGIDGADPPVTPLGGTQAAQGSTMVRRPTMGSSSLAVSWSAAPIPCPPFGLFFSLILGGEGWAGTILDGGGQWWRMEEGRCVDVYY